MVNGKRTTDHFYCRLTPAQWIRTQTNEKHFCCISQHHFKRKLATPSRKTRVAHHEDLGTCHVFPTRRSASLPGHKTACSHVNTACCGFFGADSTPHAGNCTMTKAGCRRVPPRDTPPHARTPGQMLQATRPCRGSDLQQASLAHRELHPDPHFTRSETRALTGTRAISSPSRQDQANHQTVCTLVGPTTHPVTSAPNTRTLLHASFSVLLQ